MTERKKERRSLITCALICAITAYFSFLYFALKNNGFFTICDDFDTQQLPFTIALHNALKGGIAGWTWNYDLGVSTIQGFSFYELGSPFFWLSMLFPANWFPYVVVWIYILKYVVAGTTSYLYFRKFVRNPEVAIAGSLLYAFSGFQTVNLEFYHFHDVVALFPLLLIGLEDLLETGKTRMFILAVFVNCLLNYYFFVIEAVFLVIYFLFRMPAVSISCFVPNALKCIICGVLGIGMAAVLFLPNVMYILNSPRSDSELYLSNLAYDVQTLVFVLKGFLFPGEAMTANSSIIYQDWRSVDCYLPMLGLTFVIAYCLKSKDWLSKIIVFLTVASFVPIISSGFLLFAEATFRWWFTLDIMMALASCIVLDNLTEYNIRKSSIINIIALLMFVALLSSLTWSKNSDFKVIFSKPKFYTYAAISLIGIITTCSISKNGKTSYFIAGISVFAIITTAATLFVYRANATTERGGADTTRADVGLGVLLEEIDPQYRYNTSENCLPLSGKAAGLRVYSSTVSQSSREFDKLFDFSFNTCSMDKNTIEGLPELLGAKYCTSTEKNDKVVREYSVNGAEYYVNETLACPIGFRVEKYISKTDLNLIDKNNRGVALLYAAVVDDIDEEKVKSVAEKIDGSQIEFDEPINEIIRKNVLNKVNDFSRDNRGFSCSTNYDADSLVYFSVLNDDGWTAKIDGNEAEIMNSGGMMMLKVSGGEHTIELNYKTPGFIKGEIISAVSIVAFLPYCGYEIIKEKRK